MAQLVSCPSVEDLSYFLLGRLPDADAERLQRHLAGCAACQARAQTLKVDDTLINALRAQAEATPGPEDHLVEDLIARLRQRGPAEVDTLALEAATPSAAPAPEKYDFLAPPQAADEIGRLGPYRVLRVLGAGGMGVVFLAEDCRLLRRVALKAMKPALAAGDAARRRFVREARATAAVKHDHVVTIHQVDEDRGVPFLAMEFLEGEPLHDRLARAGRLPTAEVLRVGREVAEGLAAAHARGLIHRDVKPGNIWLEGDRGRVKLLDFGLARAAVDDAHLTQEGAVVGTPAFMAPEQALGQTVDARGDLFSLGAVLYRAATGQTPFRGADPISTLFAVAHNQPQAPHVVNPAVPAALSDLIMRLLAKRPDDRPPSARAAAEELSALERSLAAPPTLPAVPRPRPARRRRLLVAVALGLLLLIGGGLWMQQIVLRITDPDGKTRDVPIPQGAKLELVEKPAAAAEKKKDAPPADKEEPFVLMTVDGKPRAEFRDFAKALAALKGGETVEVYGNGPYMLDPIATPKGRGLTLRAAPGYRPRFVQSEKAAAAPAWFVVQGAPLVLEGCDFHSRSFLFLNAAGSRCTIRNCRVLGLGQVNLFHVGNARLDVEDSLLHAGVVLLSARPKAEAEFRNNLVFANRLVNVTEPGGQRLRFDHNTGLAFVGFVINAKADKEAAPMTISATGNLFHVLRGMVQGVAPDGQGPCRWEGKGNLYAGAGGTTVWAGATAKPHVKTLAEWVRFWGPEEGARSAPAVQFRRDLARQAPADVMALLRAETDALRRRPGLEAVGPDWDLVGPGDAYVRALAAAGRPVPTEQLRPPGGDLPFVLLRPNKVVSGYGTLAEAVGAAKSGDTIEVRGDGPFPGHHSTVGSGRRLRLRAAAGYRPVLEGNFGTADAWAVEGLHVRNGLVGFPVDSPAKLTITQLANCSFERADGRLPVAVSAAFAGPDGKPAEIVRCLIPGGVRPQLKPGGRLAVRHSLLGFLGPVLPEEGESRVDLSHCVVRNTDAYPTFQHPPGKGKLAVTADRTVFEALRYFVDYTSDWLTRWEGSRNVYRISGNGWLAAPQGMSVASLAEWRQHWKGQEFDSAEADPLGSEPAGWRLRPDSPGYRAGPDGRDAGADVDRVARPAGVKPGT